LTQPFRWPQHQHRPVRQSPGARPSGPRGLKLLSSNTRSVVPLTVNDARPAQHWLSARRLFIHFSPTPVESFGIARGLRGEVLTVIRAKHDTPTRRTSYAYDPRIDRQEHSTDSEYRQSKMMCREIRKRRLIESFSTHTLPTSTGAGAQEPKGYDGPPITAARASSCGSHRRQPPCDYWHFTRRVRKPRETRISTSPFASSFNGSDRSSGLLHGP